MLTVYCTNEECTEYRIAAEVIAEPRDGEVIACGTCQHPTTEPEDTWPRK